MNLPLLALVAASSLSQTPAPAAAAPVAERVIVLRAQRMFDARKGTLLSPATVVVRGGRIEAVGPGAAAPEGAEVIDLGDATLLPGLIDAHVHLDMQRSDDFRKDQLDLLKKPVAERALVGATYARSTLLAGFTTVRNLGSSAVIDVGLRNAGKTHALPVPRILASGASLGATGGHCDLHGYARGVLAEDTRTGVADGPDGFRRKVRETIKYGADVIKLCATGGVLSEGDDVDVAQLTVEETRAAVEEARELRRKVAVHAHGTTGARRAVEAGAHSIEHGTFLDDATLRLMKQKGTFLVPTPLNQKIYDEQIARGAAIHPRVREKIEQARKGRRDSFLRAMKVGVRIAFGTDAGVIPHGRNAEQLAMFVEYGMSAAEALRSATVLNAELLGLAHEVGALEAGKAADVVAVRGNALENIRATEAPVLVMKDGVVVRRDLPPAR